MNLFQGDPGQVLASLDTPEADAIKAADAVDEPRFEVGSETPPRHAFGLVDDARTVAQQDQILLARGTGDVERMEQCKPLGVPARAIAEVVATMDGPT